MLNLKCTALLTLLAATVVAHQGTPKGDIVKAADLGLPLYPGSRETPEAGRSIISDDSEARRVISFRMTKDDPEKVAAFYRFKFNVTQASTNPCCGGKTATLMGNLKNGAEAKVVATHAKADKSTTVMVTVKRLKAKPKH